MGNGRGWKGFKDGVGVIMYCIADTLKRCGIFLSDRRSERDAKGVVMLLTHCEMTPIASNDMRDADPHPSYESVGPVD